MGVSAAPSDRTAVAQDARGRLLVAGGYGQGSVLVRRPTAAAQLDGKFGTGGRTTIDVGGIAQSMAVQRDGRVGASNANVRGADGRRAAHVERRGRS
jgi:hypothetical protein